jgi:hypothetical protein
MPRDHTLNSRALDYSPYPKEVIHILLARGLQRNGSHPDYRRGLIRLAHMIEDHLQAGETQFKKLEASEQRDQRYSPSLRLKVWKALESR